MNTYTIELPRSSKEKSGRIMFWIGLLFFAITYICAAIYWQGEVDRRASILIYGNGLGILFVGVGLSIASDKRKELVKNALSDILNKQQHKSILCDMNERPLIAIFDHHKVFTHHPDWKHRVLVCQEFSVNDVLKQSIRIVPKEIEEKIKKMQESSSTYKFAGALIYGVTGLFAGMFMDSVKNAILGNKKEIHVRIQYHIHYKTSEKESRSVNYDVWWGTIKQENADILPDRITYVEQYVQEVDLLMKSTS